MAEETGGPEDTWAKAWDEAPPADANAESAVELEAADLPDEPEQVDPEVQPGEDTQVTEKATEPDQFVQALQRIEQSNKEYSQSVTQSVGGLAEQLRQVNAEAAVAKQTPGGPSQAQIEEAQKDPESWAKLKEDYADWAGPIEEMFDHRIKAALKAAGTVDERKLEDAVWNRIQTRLQEEKARENQQAAEQRRQQAEHQAKVDRALTDVTKVHPDFLQTCESPDFRQWQSEQSEGIQRLALSYDARDAITMINLYKASRPTQRSAVAVTQARQQRLRQSVFPNQTISQAPARPVDTSKMTFDEYWEYDTKRKEAQRQHRATPRA